MPKLFHRKLKISNLNNIVDPNNPIEETQDTMQEMGETFSHELNQLTKGKLGDHFKTIKHLKSYPLIQETQKHMDNCVITKVIIANTEPMMVKVLNSKPLQIVSPVTNFIDKVSYSSLKLTEKIVPSIKTKTFKILGDEIMTPVNKTRSVTKKVKNGMVNKGHRYVYQPTNSKIIQWRKYYNDKFYDTKGKPLVRGTFDPVILPLNNVFENSTHKYFPQCEPVNGKFSCEFDRSVALSIKLIQNVIPIVESKTTEVIKSPFHYANHVNSVINKHIDMESNLCLSNTARATYGSMIELYQEFWFGCKKRAPLKYFVKKDFKEQIVDSTITHPTEVIEETVQDVTETVTSAGSAIVNTVEEHLPPRPHEITINMD
ncbi:sporulation-specific protein 4 [Monosporozyma unispora]